MGAAWRVGQQQQVFPARRPAHRGADGHLRSVHGAVDHGRGAAERLVQLERDRARPGGGMWFVFPQVLGFIVFFIAGLAETHRLPFDLPEAEMQLAAGFHTEYSSMKFGLIMVGEYIGVILSSAMIVTLFFGGWLGRTSCPPSSGSRSRRPSSSAASSCCGQPFRGRVTTSSCPWAGRCCCPSPWSICWPPAPSRCCKRGRNRHVESTANPVDRASAHLFA